jgi:hypothetical protein
MIPKIIHYCWFGGKPLPKLETQCMKSWAQVLPDYKVMRWDENTFDINSVPFVKEAYEAKKFAFVADYVRLYALTKFGGIYLDTDVEVVKPLDDLLHYEAFGGFETANIMQTGVLATTTENEIMQEFFARYWDMHYQVDSKGENLTQPNSAILADILASHGLRLDNTRQSICGMELFPQEYFCPIDQATRQIRCTTNTYCIHYLSGSWFPRRLRWQNNAKRMIGRIFGYQIINLVRQAIRR